MTLPNIGDKIVVIDPILTNFFGSQWVVKKRPVVGDCFGPDNPDIVWLTPESGPNWPKSHAAVFLFPCQYKLVGES